MLKPETVQWLQRALRQGSFSSAGLAPELCERDGWRNPLGKLCAASARKALPRLAEQLGLALPPVRAIAAWQVFSLAPYARDALETPAQDLLRGDEREMIGAFVERRQLRPPAEPGRPFGTDIRSWVVLLARMVGRRPSKRRPCPGNEVPWRACVRLQAMVLGMQTLRRCLDRLCVGMWNAGSLYPWPLR